MKKIISTAFIGAFGGACALIANHFLFISHTNQATGYNPYVTPVKLANYSGISSTTPDFVASAEKSINSVVHIKTTVESNNNLAYDPFQEWLFGGRQRQPNIMQGSGSGVIISDDGYIVTNNHVVKDASKIEVILNDKRSYQAEVIGLDPNTDLALLKISDKNLPFVSYGNSDHVKIGEWVLAVGNPFNLNSTVTAGIISAKGRNINILEHSNTPGGIAPIESFLQTDAAVNPGNSGGPVLSKNGDVVGILSARQLQADGVVFAIRSANIYHLLNKLKQEDIAYQKIKLPSYSSLKNIDRTQQIKRVKDCVFMIKVY